MISLIVCHHKGRKLLLAALQSLRNQKKVKCEIIVVTSVPCLKLPWNDIKTIYSPGGPAPKRNVGCRYANGDYLAFFDDDIEANDHAVYEMYQVLKRNPVGMVFGKLLNMDDPSMFDEAGGYLTDLGFIWARGDRKRDDGQFEKVEPIFAGKSAACMIKKKVFFKIGMFDVSFGILGEESELAWRVWLCGKKVMYCPQSVTLHAFNCKRKTKDYYSNRRVYFNGCKNYIYMLSTNLEPWNLIKILPIHVMCWVISGLSMIFKGRFQEGSLIFEGIWYNLTHLRQTSLKRQKIKEIRVKSDHQLFKYIKKDIGLSYYASRYFRYLKQSLHG